MKRYVYDEVTYDMFHDENQSECSLSLHASKNAAFMQPY